MNERLIKDNTKTTPYSHERMHKTYYLTAARSIEWVYYIVSYYSYYYCILVANILFVSQDLHHDAELYIFIVSRSRIRVKN